MKTAKGKKSIGTAGGVSFLLIGGFTISAVSISAYELIVQHQFDPGMNGSQWSKIIR